MRGKVELLQFALLIFLPVVFHPFIRLGRYSLDFINDILFCPFDAVFFGFIPQVFGVKFFFALIRCIFTSNRCSISRDCVAIM